MSRLHKTPKEIEDHRKLSEAYYRWRASPEAANHGLMTDLFRLFKTAFEAGRLEAELDHLGLERITVEAVVPEPGYYETQEEWVVHRGQTYRKKRKRS